MDDRNLETATDMKSDTHVANPTVEADVTVALTDEDVRRP